MSRFEKLSQENNKPKAEASEEIFMTKSEIEALREEAEQIERELEEDPFIDSMDPPKELYNRIVQELKDKGIYHEDEEDVNEEKEEVVEEKKKVVFYSRWKRAGKCAAIVCLTMLGVFGVAMTSEVNRVYLMEQVESILGNDANVKINNDLDRKESSYSEELARQQIEEELELKVPLFTYIPKGMKFMDFKVDKEGGNAVLQFDYYDTQAFLYMSNSQSDSAEFSTYDGEVIDTVEIMNVDLPIEIKKIKDENDKKESYTASWKYKNSYFEFSGKIDKEEFVKIIKKIVL